MPMHGGLKPTLQTRRYQAHRRHRGHVLPAYLRLFIIKQKGTGLTPAPLTIAGCRERSTVGWASAHQAHSDVPMHGGLKPTLQHQETPSPSPTPGARSTCRLALVHHQTERHRLNNGANAASQRIFSRSESTSKNPGPALCRLPFHCSRFLLMGGIDLYSSLSRSHI